MEFMDNIKKNLKKLLKQVGLTNYGFACEVGISKTAITLYLNGERKPSLETCKKIIIYCATKNISVTLEYLRPDLGIRLNS